jgi:hypothetical protein
MGKEEKAGGTGPRLVNAIEDIYAAAKGDDHIRLQPSI